jgi:four helix bundle suffix protein
MVQAARSGRQNIAEGSRASAASSQTELRLVNVARASLDELLLDYEDFLRQRKLPAWSKDDPQAKAVRQIGQKNRSDQSDRIDHEAYQPWLSHADPAIVANTLICLIHQANYLLDRQIAGLEQQFISEGGYSERLAAARLRERQRQSPNTTDPSDRTGLTDEKLCSKCGKPMMLRTARQGANAGSQFWGCSGYPECKSTLPVT